MRKPMITSLRPKLAESSFLAIAVFLFGHCGIGINEARSQYFRAPVRDSQPIMQRNVWSYTELQRRNIVMQERDFSCGAAALATIVRYYWGDLVTEELFLQAVAEVLTDPADQRDRIENGLTMTDLRRAAVARGYLSTIARLSFKELTESKAPVVVGIVVDEYDHFAVFRGADSYYVYLADPARGNIRVPIWEFLPQWQENAVLVVAKADRDPPTTSPLSVRRDEMTRGQLNRQLVRRQLSQPVATPPLP